jgi:hypoxanthine phosphoribosyltransferase
MTNSSTIKVLISEEAIANRIHELALEIAELKPRKLLVIPVLKGSFMFAADLIRAMHRAGLSPDVEFIQLSSYRKATVSSGQVDIIKNIESSVEDRDILLLDDILESGRTLAYAKDLLSACGAASVLTCVLLEKPNKRAVQITPDFVGFECPDQFVVGYGMDVAHSLRELPFVGIMA